MGRDTVMSDEPDAKPTAQSVEVVAFIGTVKAEHDMFGNLVYSTTIKTDNPLLLGLGILKGKQKVIIKVGNDNEQISTRLDRQFD
jgi:hypothetical protein